MILRVAQHLLRLHVVSFTASSLRGLETDPPSLMNVAFGGFFSSPMFSSTKDPSISRDGVKNLKWRGGFPQSAAQPLIDARWIWRSFEKPIGFGI
jgi:hypothetical protein